MKFLKLIVVLMTFITIPVFCFYVLQMTDASLYNLSLAIAGEAIQHTVIISFSISLALGSALSPFLSNRDIHKHVSGPRILSNWSAIKHARKALRVAKKTRGLLLHPHIATNKSDESGNVFCFGMQGAGKSTVIKFWLNQLMQRSVTILIYDEKREYTEHFLQDGAFLLCPGDARSVTWDLSADITDVSSARTFADSVIHQTSNEPFWSDSARLVVTGALVCLVCSGKPWGWGELHALLFKDPSILQKELKQYFPEAALFADPDNKTSASVLGVVSSQLSWVKYVSDVLQPEAETFSFSDWLNADEPTKLIVQTNHSYKSMSQSFFSAALSSLTNHVLGLTDCSKREVWLVLDELAAIPKNDSIERWLSRGRSKGARTIAGTQSISQLQSIYGEKNAETILGLFSTVIVLRVGAAGQSASMASQILGKRRVISISNSMDSAGKKSVTESEQEIPVVTIEQIVHLSKPDQKGIKGYLSIAGTYAIYELKWPYPSLSKVAVGFQPIVLSGEKRAISAGGLNSVAANPFIKDK